MAARELEGTLDAPSMMTRLRNFYSGPGVIASFPSQALVEGFSTRLKAEQTLDVQMTMGFRFSDVGESYALEIRRGIAQFHDAPSGRSDILVSLEKSVLVRILAGETTIDDALASGSMKVIIGTPAQVRRFLAYFEEPFASAIALTVR